MKAFIISFRLIKKVLLPAPFLPAIRTASPFWSCVSPDCEWVLVENGPYNKNMQSRKSQEQ